MRRPKWVLATDNAGKAREFKRRMSDIEWLLQSDLGIESPEETGTTFEENALIKASHAAQSTDLPVLADDSGLEVDALNGRPGVYSARFAGPDAKDKDNIARLLEELGDADNRTARFRCVLCLVAPDAQPVFFRGKWEGTILEVPRGKAGFGYDPVFFDPILQRSAAELEPELKNEVSHRGRALTEMMARLQNA